MSARKRANQKSSKQKPAKRRRRDAGSDAAPPGEQVRARRAMCSMLRFWQACGHTKCLRTRACALASNDCFGRFWPLVPEQAKFCIRAGMVASAAGLLVGRNRRGHCARAGALVRNAGAARAERFRAARDPSG